MSEQEQQQVSQNEQVDQGSEAVAAQSQQDVLTTDKVLESAEKPTVETSEPAITEEQADSESNKEKVADEKVEPATEKEEEAGEKKALPEESGAEKTDQPADEQAPDTAEVTNGDADVVKTNGDVAEKDQPAVTEETNGVHKRKAENGSEPVSTEDEKSPKKAKVVEDGDQAKVEETAA